MSRLILFDVDGTLIARGDPAHLAAIDAGLHAAFPNLPASINDIDFDGKVDRQILREILRVGGIAAELSESVLQAILEAAATDYRRSWEGRRSDADLLPGVRQLIVHLSSDPEFSLGLLTGGIRRVVEAKLKRLGLEEYFPIGAFGDEVEMRAALLPLALKRAATYYDAGFDDRDVVVVGDTPHDVAAAHAGHVACLAVATGRFSVDELRDAGADAVLQDLADTTTVIGILRSVKPAGTRT